MTSKILNLLVAAPKDNSVGRGNNKRAIQEVKQRINILLVSNNEIRSINAPNWVIAKKAAEYF